MITYRISDLSITFDRDHYFKNQQIYAVVSKMCGSSLDPNPRWRWSQAFGYTTITFVNREDYKQFKTWVRANRHLLVYDPKRDA